MPNSPRRASRPVFEIVTTNGVRSLVATNVPANAGITLPRITFDSAMSMNHMRNIRDALEIAYWHDTPASRVGVVMDLDRYAGWNWDFTFGYDTDGGSAEANWSMRTMADGPYGYQFMIPSDTSSEGTILFSQAIFGGATNAETLANVFSRLSHELNSPWEHTNWHNGQLVAGGGHPLLTLHLATITTAHVLAEPTYYQSIRDSWLAGQDFFDAYTGPGGAPDPTNVNVINSSLSWEQYSERAAQAVIKGLRHSAKTRRYGYLYSVQDANPYAAAIAAGTVTAGELGGTIGSALGNALAGRNLIKGVLYSSVLGELGERLGIAIANGSLNAALEINLDQRTGQAVSSAASTHGFASDVWLRMQQATIGTVSSLLALELGEALGLEGFGAELFNTVGSTVLNKVFTNVLSTPSAPFAGFNLDKIGNGFGEGMFAEGGVGSLALSAVGAFLGAKLGAMVVTPQTQAAQVLSSVGSATGAFLAVKFAVAGGAFKLTMLGNLVVPGIGAFVGFVIGALIGNLFGRKKPKVPTANASTYLDYTSDQFLLGSSSAANGGNLNLVVSMASSARDTLNGFLAVMTGDFAADALPNTYWSGSYTFAGAPSVTFGHTGNQLWLNSGQGQVNVASADEAVEKGVMATLPKFQLAGGDLLVKRAISAFFANGGSDLTALMGDLQIASDYRYYGSNRQLINGYISTAYHTLDEVEQSFYASNKALVDKVHTQGAAALTGSDLNTYNLSRPLIEKIVRALEAQTVANPWIVTLQRVTELGLDDFRSSDFNGGLQGFLMSFDTERHRARLEDVSLSRVGNDLRIATAASSEEGLFRILPQASPDGRSVDVTGFFGANPVGYVTGSTVNTAGRDFIDRSGETSGVTITDYQEEVYPGFGYWVWVGWGPQPIEDHMPMADDPNWMWVEGEPQVVATTGGDDIFLGGWGHDLLQGHAGWDWLSGGAGDDTIEGGAGNDVLIGGVGNDALYGGVDADYLAGGDGSDTLYAGAGNDTLIGGAANDSLFGEGGDDVLLIDENDGHYNWLDGGSGSDALSFERWSQAVVFTLGSGGAGGVAEDAYSAIEDLIGSQFADTLTGDWQANRLYGGEEDDTLNGADGDDLLEGGGGADVLIGGNGTDTAGYASSRGGVFVDLTTGKAFGGDASGDTFSSVENVRGSDAGDELKGDVGTNTLEGLKGDDWFVATQGSDVYDGGEGNDTADYSTGFSAVSVSGQWATWWGAAGGYGYHSLAGVEQVLGTDGADSIYLDAGANGLIGGKGNDNLGGGAGGDTYYFEVGDGADTVVETNDGSNVLSFGDGVGFNQLSFTVLAGPSGYMIFHYGGADSVYVGGNVPTVQQGKLASADDNRIKVLDMNGSGQLDVSQFERYTPGSMGGDYLTGLRTLGDLMVGFGGNDTMYGMQVGQWDEWGNIFIGGAGDDTLVSSVGDDQYAFERGSGRDTVYDSGGEDVLVFGPNVDAEDVIYKVVGSDLYIGIRDATNLSLEAHQVADYVRIVDGGVKWQDVYYGTESFNTMEFVNAGGSWIDLRKLDLGWTVQATYGGGAPPIVFDLAGDGLELTGVEASKIVSKTASGQLARTGWVGPTDGMLAFDRDGDGQINRLSEISFLGDKPGAKTDLEGLQAWDTNADGKLNALDDGWSKLKIWVDRNQNGRSTSQELRTLEQAGIAEISLKGMATGQTAATTRDSFVHNTLSFTWASGEKGTAYDVQLARRLLNELGLTADQVRAAWGNGSAEGELGRLVDDPIVTAATRAILAKEGRRDHRGNSMADFATQLSDNDLDTVRAPMSGATDVAGDFTDHDNLFAEDEARWADALAGRDAQNGEGVLTTTDAVVRAALDAARGAADGDPMRHGFNRPTFAGGPGTVEVTESPRSARDLPPSRGANLPWTMGAAEPVGRLSLQPRLTVDLDQAAQLLMSQSVDDAWRPAEVTLANAKGVQRWWSQSVPGGDLTPEGRPHAKVAQYGAVEWVPVTGDLAAQSAHQQLTQAIAAFGPRTGGGAAVWKRSGEGAEYADAAADGRHRRWNLNAPARMAG